MTNRIDIGRGMALNFTRKDGETTPSDVWLQFHGEDGKSAAISIAAEAERMGGIIGGGLRSWASDRINEHLAALADPVGARMADCDRRQRCEEGVNAICHCQESAKQQ